MRAILGIGNPGREYASSRHNCGFMVVEELRRRHDAGPWHRRWHADTAQCRDVRLRDGDGDDRILLVQPQTFVNASGPVAQAVLAFHKAPPEHLLVVVDDINLPFGHLRLRPQGSAGGHNGLKDIEAHLGQAYPRLRLGIGRPENANAQIGYVLGAFSSAEAAVLPEFIARAADCAEAWVREGVAIACRFNGPGQAPGPLRKPS